MCDSNVYDATRENNSNSTPELYQIQFAEQNFEHTKWNMYAQTHKQLATEHSILIALQ